MWGVVPQQSSKCHVTAHRIRIYQGTLIKVSHAHPVRIQVKVNVILPQLKIFHPHMTGDFTLVNFEPTFLGTERFATMVVQNISAITTSVVVLGEVNGDLVDINQGNKEADQFSVFTVAPFEGRLEPFEGRIYTVYFKPLTKKAPTTGWQRDAEKRCITEDYLVFMRLIRVQCVGIAELEKSVDNYLISIDHGNVDIDLNGMMTTVSGEIEESNFRKTPFTEVSTLMMTKGTVDKVVRLCLHGLGVYPELELQPTAIDFGTVQVGAIETRVLRLTNPCCLPLTYRYRKVACLEVKPAWATLRANSALEVVVSTVHTSLVLELLSPECPSIKDSKYMVVGHRTLTVSYNAPSVTILPKIVFNLGISPLRGNEVGFLTGDVRFDMDVPKPRGAMIRADLTETSPWPRLETCDVMERGEPEDRATWTGVKVPLQCQGQLFLIDSGLSEMDSDVMNRGEIKIILTLSPSTLGSLRSVLSSPSSDSSESQCRRTQAGKRSVAKPP
uniref:Uncharacterized protein n=1 Tax=Timema bartmani TaxID=61472 RepID=A0A7R9F6V7_9NEOP|nr:unnamed protein product [Timema bartmani]